MISDVVLILKLFYLFIIIILLFVV